MLKIKKLAFIEAGQYLWKLTALYHLIKVNFKHKCGCEGAQWSAVKRRNNSVFQNDILNDFLI